VLICSGEKCSATMVTLVASGIAKGLILRQEIGDRDERNQAGL